MPSPTSRSPILARLRAHPLMRDAVIVLIVCAVAGVWATRFWNAWTRAGGQPVFYQSYFEPAVMIACGHGFVISTHQPKPLEDFLFLRADRFDCGQITPDVQLGRDHLYQEAWTYLQYTVGYAWKVLGISWSGMGPLFGLLFGIVVAVAYCVFRLGMSAPLAVICSTAVAVSSTHLLNLPHLRDYSKAPFTLALVLILGVTVLQPVRRWSLLGLAAAYGLVLGIGYGFRTDFLAALPVMVITIFLFLEGGLIKHLPLKAAASTLLVATFVVVSWPASSAVYKKGGCQWHVALLGLQAPFDDFLRVAPASYDFGYAYADGYIQDAIDGYARRMSPGSDPLVFCSHEYDVQSAGLLRGIVTSFPGDIATRAYASVLQIIELPLRGSSVGPMPSWAPSIYSLRASLLKPSHRWGALFAALMVVIAGAASLRLGLFLLFFLAYFGGYPAIQFQERHHFHLEFIGWFAFGFVIHQALQSLWSLRSGVPAAGVMRARAIRAVAITALTAVCVVGSLWVTRGFQESRARALLASYVAAPKTALPSLETPLPDVAATDWPQFLEVQLDQRACGDDAAVTFRYSSKEPAQDFTHTVKVAYPSRAPGMTRVFMPVFHRFERIEPPANRPGCVSGASRFNDLRGVPLLLGAVLTPDWETHSALHQRLRDWESDPQAPTFSPLPALSSWTTSPGVQASRTLFGGLTVQGDSTEGGYQVSSPVVRAARGSRVFLRFSISQSSGNVCVGALDATAAHWVAPATSANGDSQFLADDSGGFIVVVTNCNGSNNTIASRFTVQRAEFALDSPSRD